MKDDGTSVKNILLRNAVVALIFVYLFASNFAGYTINFFVVLALIAIAWLATPVAQTFRHLWSMLDTRQK